MIGISMVISPTIAVEASKSSREGCWRFGVLQQVCLGVLKV